MKKTLFFFSCLVFIISAKAQQYVPFPDSNAYWSEYFSSYGYPNYKYTYFIKGDTILGSHIYHKVYLNDSAHTSFLVYPAYEGGIREENKKVYFFDRNCSFPLLLYDFNFIVGDSIRGICFGCDTTTNAYMHVLSIDSVLLSNMTYRRRINFNSNFNYSWIEGIGSMTGLLYYNYACTTCMCTSIFVCFKQNDTVLYINPNETVIPCFSYNSINEFISNNSSKFQISPNPASSEIEVVSPQSSVVSIEVYNMLGEKVYQSLVNSHSSSGIPPMTNVPMTTALMTIDVSSFSAGMYFMEIKTEQGVVVKKFIKE